MAPIRALVIGFGNPGRGDDGLGPALAEAVDRLGLPGVTTEEDYQLAPEHAVPMGEHDLVVFADAAVSGPEPFGFDRLVPRSGLPFSSHCLEPAGVLALAEQLSGRPVVAYLLAIRGYEFEPFCEVLSDQARRNLELAVAFLGAVLRGETGATIAGVRAGSPDISLTANSEGER